VRLSDRERFEYNELFQRFKEYVQMAVSGHRSRVSATVLHSIHELRLFCNNGLRKAGTGILESDDELFSLLQLHDMNLCAHCAVCIFSIDEVSGGIFIANCKHLVCHGCYPHCYTLKKACLLCRKGHAPVRPSDDSMLALPPGSAYSQQPVTEFPSKLLALRRDLQSDMGIKW
jgi:SWI/SNF-related matrix-associated actin-dependent regulator of chromatin subfamily A3